MSEKVILLANLGSPDSTEVKDVKAYLSEFLMDEKVIDIPYWLRLLLVRGIIVPSRAPKSAEKYRSVWTKEGSPLIVITRRAALQLSELTGLPVHVCMRYAKPTPDEAFKKIIAENPDLREVILLPMYPHYAMSSYETAVEHVKQAHQRLSERFELKIVEPYYQHASYISALADSIRPHLTEPFDHVLFSYHGLPERHLRKTDPTKSHCMTCDNCCDKPSEAHAFCYRHQVIETTRQVMKTLGLKEEQCSFSFQSRLGRDQWLKPYTTAKLKQFPSEGIKRLLVVCPAFVSDCLETLEEIQMEGKEDFLSAGGESYRVVPCLNTNEAWIETMAQLTNEA